MEATLTSLDQSNAAADSNMGTRLSTVDLLLCRALAKSDIALGDSLKKIILKSWLIIKTLQGIVFLIFHSFVVITLGFINAVTHSNSVMDKLQRHIAFADVNKYKGFKEKEIDSLLSHQD